MNLSLNPTWAAADTGPILKLWPETLDLLIPAFDRTSRTCTTRSLLDSGVPSRIKNNGPGCDGRIARTPILLLQGRECHPCGPGTCPKGVDFAMC